MGVEPRHVDVLIGLPGAAGYKPQLGLLAEAREARNLHGGTHHVCHPIEARIARNGHILHSHQLQKPARTLVLHIEAVETQEHPPEHSSNRPEEPLAGAENTRYDIGRNPTPTQLLEIIAPEFVFYENRHRRPCSVEKFFHPARSVERQIDYGIDKRIVLPHLETRRRKETEQNWFLRMLAPQAFYHGAPLLELSERRGVKPYAPGATAQTAPQSIECALLPLDHFSDLRASQRRHPGGKTIKADACVV